MTELVGEVRAVPDERTGDRAGIRIEQQFVGVEAVAAPGRVRPVDAVAVDLAGTSARKKAVNIRLQSISEEATLITIHVGATGDEALARQVLERIERQL